MHKDESGHRTEGLVQVTGGLMGDWVQGLIGEWDSVKIRLLVASEKMMMSVSTVTL